MANVEVCGTRLEYAEQGRGQPVVFVHGGSADLRVWKNQLEFLGSKYRAIAVSCRGYYPNQERQVDESVSLNTFVNDLVNFIEVLDLAPVHLVGHSSPGGFGSLLLAHQHPKLLRSLFLIEPPAFSLLGVHFPPRPLEIFRLLIRRPLVALGFIKFGATGIGPAMRAFARGEDEKGLEIFMRANLGSETFAKMPKRRFQQALENINPLRAQIRAGFPPFPPDNARNIQTPTLLVSGEKSNAVLHGIIDRIEDLLPNAERIDIQNASHNMFETDPESFNWAVINFLNRH